MHDLENLAILLGGIGSLLQGITALLGVVRQRKAGR